jgi:hypothetical protein
VLALRLERYRLRTLDPPAPTATGCRGPGSARLSVTTTSSVYTYVLTSEDEIDYEGMLAKA